MKVVKFGGASLGSAEGMSSIIGIIKHNAGQIPVAVVSALSNVTDELRRFAEKAAIKDPSYIQDINAMDARHRALGGRFLKGDAKKKADTEIKETIAELRSLLCGVSLLGELSVRTMDLAMSFGERLSAQLLTSILNANGIKAQYLDARTLIKADSSYGNAQYIAKESYANIASFFARQNKNRPLQVTTGFIASTAEGQTVTLGRGGSDLTAAIFAAALKAGSVEFWKDVDGIYTADPKLVKNAFKIDQMHYSEAMEISHFGAKVLFPLAIQPVLEKGIPIVIRNTFNAKGEGTRIDTKTSEESYPVKGISSIANITLVRIQGPGMTGVAGFSARVFGALARRKINVVLITQSSSEYSICFAVLPQEARSAHLALEEEFSREIGQGSIDKPIALTGLSVIAVVGMRMKNTSGVSGKFFHALGRNGINIVAIAQGSSEINISAVIARQDESKALNAVHEAFFQSTVRSVNVFLLGTGNIGGTLLDQIAEQQVKLAENDKIKINLAGAANVDSMVFCSEGLDPKKIKKILRAQAGKDKTAVQPFDLRKYVANMIELNLPNACFCDCTASDAVASMYEKILKSSISIVTPNKRANSGPMKYYKKLIDYSRERRIPFLYETTVCAGLPLISTLRDLNLSGDRVRRIEAVLSGTLSYIFNSFDGKKTFSALVREAKAKGYTEPDPRDDLNAKDAARKALILARECGHSLEFEKVAIEPILPPACIKAKSVDAFFAELEKHDAAFEKLRAHAAAQGKSLRYITVIEDGRAKLTLRAEAPGSPFCSLVDSDNIVVITTDRYARLPMVIKGPGAGAQVTAGGVFADIVRIARTLV